MVALISPLVNGHTATKKNIALVVEEALSELPIHEQVQLLGGKDFWHLNDLPHRNIPSVRLSDGPNGCRGTNFFNGQPSSCLPCATGLAASFDLDYIRDIGVQLGQECRAKAVHTGNEQEFERMKADSIISERALREIYLEPFRMAVKEAQPRCFMTGYNRLNGTHCSENAILLNDILRKEWGYDGLVMSDWTGTVSSAGTIKAGLDLEMPGPPVFRGSSTLRELQCGKLTPEDISSRAREVLKLVAFAQQSGIPFGAEEGSIDTAESRRLLRRAAAEAVVLLKNENGILPLRQPKKIAVIGHNARVAVVSGGGSAQLSPTFSTTPLAAITKAAESAGAEVKFAIGCLSYHYLPVATPLLSYPHDGSRPDVVASLSFWLSEPHPEFKSPKDTALRLTDEPDHNVLCNTAFAFITDGVPKPIVEGFPYMVYSSHFTPDQSCDWEFSLASVGHALLFIDGQLVADNTEWEQGDTFFGMGSRERKGIVKNMRQGRSVKVEIRSWPRDVQRVFPVKIAGAVRLGAVPMVDEAVAIAQAAKLAQESDTAVVVVGLNEDFECEGHDRTTINLPGAMNELVASVLAVKPDAIIVTQSGMPVAMPWADQAASLLHAFYGGNDLGTGIADVLFGKINPSSRLPVSFPRALSDMPSGTMFGAASPSPLRAVYTEVRAALAAVLDDIELIVSQDIYVGYRYFDHSGIRPLFPFGHGLSYTTFKYSDLILAPCAEDPTRFEISFGLTNSGALPGAEVSQIYVYAVEHAHRPQKELRAFTKTHLQVGENVTVNASLDRDAFKTWHEVRSCWTVAQGQYEVWIGQSAERIVLKGTLSIKETLYWSGL
ncbi:hypothetical protein EHS25_002914 [Saitozyma podzolica]|uniref:beta-glucosidase n=1 Tax=Saitozyma podzolica TaxID=1890683 RepID=A0A427YCL1_9TREE|nr:hypothetical protein EHS25_002914 [Saitozyma podzolica]